MITWRLRNLSLKEVHHGTRTLAPIVSPDHGGGTNLTPHRRQLPAPHGEYDANPVFDAAGAVGYQLLAPREDPDTGLGHHYQSPCIGCGASS